MRRSVLLAVGVMTFASLPTLADTSAATTQSLRLSQPSKTTAVQPLRRRDVDTRPLAEQAAEWGLTEAEWQRYLALKYGERGYWSPNLDPLTTLGIEATSDAERERYARLLAKKEYQRVEKELAFQSAYDKAFKELYPNELPFQVDKHISQTQGRIFYFTKLEQCEKCEADIERVLSYANNKTPIDIFFVGQADNEKIRQWAIKHKIDPRKVQRKEITLNHDQGYWVQYADKKIPVAYQVESGQWQPIAY